MDPAAWDAEQPDFQQPLHHAQSHEDWEDWLRWDPAVEPVSPEDGTNVSGSSKDHSPVQQPLLPVDPGPFFAKNETLAPPLIVGEDGMELGVVGGDHVGSSLLFGGGVDDLASSANFAFQSDPQCQALASSVPRIDTSMLPWTLPSNDASHAMDFSAIASDTYHSVTSAGAMSSNPPSLHHSPDASTQNRSSFSSHSPDPPKKRGGRKRKIDSEPDMGDSNGDSNEDGDGDGPPVKKTSHNVIEKRYRNNLNDKIVELRNSVPSLRAMGRPNSNKDSEDLQGLTPAHKLNKATVMAKATEYIRHLEKRNKTMSDEMSALKTRLAAVEAAIGRSIDRQATLPNGPSDDTSMPRRAASASHIGPQSFLNVAPDQSNFAQQLAQQQYSQAHGFPSYQPQSNATADARNPRQPANAGGRQNIMNKVMLGTMAGLMVMEGYNEQQPADGSNSRGLSALPLHILKRDVWSQSTATLSRQAIIPLLKVVVIIGALLCLLAPLLAWSPRRKQKSRSTAVRLPHAPSLASPIEVRQKAWLTAIQTVWVPKHFLLEVVAVTAKMISLSVRRLVGTEAYNILTGSNKEDEVARVKAWDIAIDAQLAGGDAEISYYRLLLTLMESGTLPDSPTRLMQKAVHFRVFFWEVANAGYGNMIGFKQLTEKVGKIYWDSARRQQRELLLAASQGRPREHDDGIELLPDHLASLVELDCDDVLCDEMIQRAWNLAWNKPSAHNTAVNVPRDAVVEDHAIRSPLDAVAAWYTHMTIDETLIESLGEHSSQIDAEYYAGLAVSVAPPASATQARALTAKAVLSNCNRDKNVLAALAALPAVSPSAGGINVVTHLPAAPDVRTALTLAKLLSLSSPSAPPAAHARAHHSVAALHLPPSAFTLLAAVAAHRLLRSLVSERRLPADAKLGIEDLAANLRVWVGTAPGRAALLGREEAARVVDLCLAVAKRVGGWNAERDSGYGSAEASPVRARGET